MEKMRRDWQRQILLRLIDKYPELVEVAELPGHEESDFHANIHYLMEHQLIDGIRREAIGVPTQYIAIRATAAGLDFLENDGGVTAILNTVTVRFDEDLRNLLLKKIKSDKDFSEGESLDQAIRSLPAASLRQVSIQLIEKAMDRLPDASRTLQILLQHL